MDYYTSSLQPFIYNTYVTYAYLHMLCHTHNEKHFVYVLIVEMLYHTYLVYACLQFKLCVFHVFLGLIYSSH